MKKWLKLVVGLTVVLCSLSANAKLVLRLGLDGNLASLVDTNYVGSWSGSGSPVYSTDAKFGQSLYFDNPESGTATNRMYIAPTGSADWAGYSNWTFSAWIKPTALGSGTSRRSIFSSGGVGNGWYTTYCQIREGGFKFTTYYTDDGETLRYNLTHWEYSVNEWWRVTVVFDADNGTVTHYRDSIDGPGGLELMGSTTNYVTPMTLTTFQIGHASTTFGFKGYMDDICIFDTALSSNEVDAISTVPEVDPAMVEGITPVSSSVVQLAIQNPDAGVYYHPVGRTDLTGDSWTNVPHSDNGVNSYVVTNLDYATHDGTNKLIYVQATNAAAFFRVDTGL